MQTIPTGLNLPDELKPRPDGRPLIMAHRGNRSVRPENSFPAFELALEEGAEVIETDLRVTQDGIVVCIHDSTLDRTTTGSGAIAKERWSTLRNLDLRDRQGAVWHGTRIPTLYEALGRLSSKTYFALELKPPAFTRSSEYESLIGLLEQFDAMDRVIAFSLSEQPVLCGEKVGVPFPLIHASVLSLWPSKRYPVVGAIWPIFYLNPFYVSISHRRSQICWPLDPTPDRRLRYYRKLGVDGLLTDNPGQTIASWNALGD